ncbi:hypothetical protein ACIG8K_18155 [Streptomyces halstedii]|uniref:hypothetical protein n=1 Tax=Streptomyces TaxID=1883 RepID=UPI00052697C1
MTRPDVMVLLFDTNFDRPSDSHVFRRLDGRLFTEEEQAMLRDATAEEFQAAGVHVHNPEADEATRGMMELLLKYALSHFEALVPFLTDEDLLEYDRLVGIIAAGADQYGPREG